MKSLAVFVVALFMAFPAWAESLVEHAENLVHHKVQFTLEPNLGKISVTDHMTLTGQGGLGFVLSSAFEVGSLRVDGVVQKPNLSNEILTIELGSKGAHTIEMTTHAKLPQRIQPPFLRAQGGLIGGDWLAHPKGYKATWDVMGQSPKGQKWLIPGTLQFESEDEKFYRARFTSERPAVLPILISGPFEVHERWVGDIRLRTYFHQN
ncbi:MAG: hypothetical protein JKY92_04345 [Magnetovibrio sp.]|nr:hypothetical protein [Magnetovibrio sp.]